MPCTLTFDLTHVLPRCFHFYWILFGLQNKNYIQNYSFMATKPKELAKGRGRKKIKA